MELDLGFTKADTLDTLPHHRGMFIDLTMLGAEASALAGVWLEQMLSGSQAVFSFSPGNMVEALLPMHTTARNLHRKNGVSPLGLGFPFVLMKTPQRTIAAPLLIWPVVLEPEAVGLHRWYLGLRENKPMYINQELCGLVQSFTGLDLVTRLKDLGDRPGWLALWEVLKEIANDFDSEGALELHPCPGIEALGSISSSPKIITSAVVGLLPPAQYPFAEIEESQKIDTPLESEGHSFGMGALDPYQVMAAEGLKEQRDIIINGGPGTGKKYLARHLIMHFLSNGRPCLVVADALPPLQELQQSFAEMGLGRLCFTFCNPREDFLVLRDFMRTEIYVERTMPAFDFKKFRLDADKLMRIKENLDKAYKATHTPLLGKDAWTNLVGKYLTSSTKQGKELLGAYLIPSDYRFEQEEFEILLHAVAEAFPLFQGIKGIDHPLSRLHPEIFLRYAKAEALERVGHKIPAYEKRVSELLHRYISCLNNYSDQLRTFMEDHCRRLTIQTSSAMDLVRDYVLEFGDTFHKSGDAALRISSMFSRSGKKIIAARDEIRKIHKALNVHAAELEEFGLDSRPLVQLKSFAHLVEGLSHFQERLKQWALELPDFVQAETLRMSASQMHSVVMPEHTPQGLEEEMELLLQEINQENLLHEPLGHRFLTLSKRGKYLEQIVQDLEALRVGLRDFSGFYDWQRFWLGLPGNARKLVRALTVIKPQDWPSAFRSWYLDQALLKWQDIALPQEIPPLQAYFARWDDLQRQLPEQISALWDNRRIALQKQVRANRELHNWLLGKGRRGRVEDAPELLFTHSGPFYSEVFPLTLATTQAAAEVLQKAAPGYFECVLSIEGQKIDPLQWHHLARYGSFSALLGDFGAENPNTGNIARQVFTLEAAHRNDPLNPFLPPLDAVSAAKEVKTSIVALEGVQEDYRDVNVAESEFLLDYLLFQLPHRHGSKAPSVSVIAFTPAQRDIIAAGLMRQKFSQGTAGDRVRQLERAGLSVLALGELEEIRSDVVLVSVVFTSQPTALWGNDIHENSPFLDRMRRLLAMPRHEMVFCHSIPVEILQRWQEYPVTAPEGFLSNYLHAARGKNRDMAQSRLSKLRQVPFQGLTREAFWEAVEGHIRPFFPTERVRRRPGEVNIPAVLEIIPESDQSPTVLLFVDGFYGNLQRTDYAWEAMFEQMLVGEGFQPYQVWSVNWWKQPVQEARRLAGPFLRPSAPSSA